MNGDRRPQAGRQEGERRKQDARLDTLESCRQTVLLIGRRALLRRLLEKGYGHGRRCSERGGPARGHGPAGLWRRAGALARLGIIRPTGGFVRSDPAGVLCELAARLGDCRSGRGRCLVCNRIPSRRRPGLVAQLGLFQARAGRGRRPLMRREGLTVEHHGDEAPPISGEIDGGGWVKLWRKTLDSDVFAVPELWHLFCWCLLSANYSVRHVQVRTGRGDTVITVGPGQFIYGRKSLARAVAVERIDRPTAYEAAGKHGHNRHSGGHPLFARNSLQLEHLSGRQWQE